jgi:hypothetical protein
MTFVRAPGAGRPKGSRDRVPRPPRSAKKREAETSGPNSPSAETDQLVVGSPDLGSAENQQRGVELKPVSRKEAEEASIAYLTAVVRDGTASADRRDRAALGLMSHLTRLKPPPPKRQRDPVDDALAGLGFRL